MRTFLACHVDAAAAEALHAALEPMRSVYRDGAYRWTPPANYHVTLRFFGELTQSDVDRVAGIVRGVAAVHAPVQCRTVAVEPLPSARRPKVVALSLESAGRLEALAASVNESLEADFGASDKSFKAHLSVIRCRRGARFVEPPAIDFSLTFASMALFESKMASGGSRYTALQTFPLGA